MSIFKIALFISLFYSFSFSAPQCINTKGTGEADIIGNDKAAAKREAISRAKWDAIDKALGTQTSVKSVTENFALLDEVITNDVQGFIENLKVLSAEEVGNTFIAQISGCVYPKAAEKALSVISKDSSFSVLILLSEKDNIKFEEMNPVNTGVIKGLIEQGFTVNNVAAMPDLNPEFFSKIVKEKKFGELSGFISKNLSGAAIIGQIEINRSVNKGEDIGYGLASVFHITTAQIQYYMLAKDNETGNMKIIAANTLSEKGRALNERDSELKAMKSLAEKVNVDLISNINNYLKFKETKVTLEVEGVRSVEENFRIKEKLQKIAWVKEVNDLGKGKFLIIFQENSIYLANSIDAMDMLKVESFSPLKIKAKYLF